MAHKNVIKSCISEQLVKISKHKLELIFQKADDNQAKKET